MSSVGTAVSGAAGRLLPRRRRRRDGDGYAFCSVDAFWFRPAYTEGKCPLCGELAAGGAAPVPLLRRMDRSWLGMAFLVVESFAMLALVVFMYLRA